MLIQCGILYIIPGTQAVHNNVLYVWYPGQTGKQTVRTHETLMRETLASRLAACHKPHAWPKYRRGVKDEIDVKSDPKKSRLL